MTGRARSLCREGGERSDSGEPSSLTAAKDEPHPATRICDENRLVYAGDEVIFAGRGTGIDGGVHAVCEDQHDITLGWIGYFRLGPRDAPRFARRCSESEQAATRVCRARGRAGHDAPEYTAVQRGVLDHLRPSGIHRDGGRSRSIHPVADSPRCKWLLRWRREIRTPQIGASRGSIVPAMEMDCWVARPDGLG
jgi:hypothetical protein